MGHHALKGPRTFHEGVVESCAQGIETCAFEDPPVLAGLFYVFEQVLCNFFAYNLFLMTTFSKNLNKLAIGISWSITGKFIGRFLSMLGDVFAARILGPSSFGLYSIGWTILRICSLLVHLGLPNAVQHFIPLYLGHDTKHAHRIIKQSILLSVLSGLFFSLLLYFFSPLIANVIFQKPNLKPIFELFALSLPFVSLLSTTAAITRATQQMRYSVLIEDVGQPLLGLILLAIFYFIAGARISGVILSDILSFVIAAPLCLWAVLKLFSGNHDREPRPLTAAKELLKFSIPTALAGTFAVFVFWVDRMLVGYFLTESENGLYQAASQISVVFVIVLAAFNSILLPMFADLYAKNDYRQLNDIFKVGTKWGLYLSLPVFLVLCFAPLEFLSLVYGEAYSGAWMALVVLSVGQIINVGTGSIGSLLAMTGNHRVWLFLSIFGMVLNIILCILLIPSFGIVGAAVGTAISLNVLYITGIFWARKNLGIWPYNRQYLKGVISLLCSAFVLLGFEQIIHGNGLIHLLLLSSLSFMSFFGMLLILGMDDEDRQVIRMLHSLTKPKAAV